MRLYSLSFFTTQVRKLGLLHSSIKRFVTTFVTDFQGEYGQRREGIFWESVEARLNCPVDGSSNDCLSVEAPMAGWLGKVLPQVCNTRQFAQRERLDDVAGRPGGWPATRGLGPASESLSKMDSIQLGEDNDTEQGRATHSPSCPTSKLVTVRSATLPRLVQRLCIDGETLTSATEWAHHLQNLAKFCHVPRHDIGMETSQRASTPQKQTMHRQTTTVYSSSRHPLPLFALPSSTLPVLSCSP